MWVSGNFTLFILIFVWVALPFSQARQALWVVVNGTARSIQHLNGTPSEKRILCSLERQSVRWVWSLGRDLSSLPKRRAGTGEVSYCRLITRYKDGVLIEGV